MRKMKDISIQEIKKAIKENKTFSDTIEYLGFNKKGSITRKTLRTIIKENNIPTEHFNLYRRKHFWLRENLELAIKQCYSMTDVLIKLGIQARSGNFTTLKEKIKKYEIDTDHFNPLKSVANLARIKNGPLDLKDILNGNQSQYSTNVLKQRLITEGIKEHKCEHCNNSLWNGKEIPLELNHIDGISNNHFLSNLELLCPNCHAQTPTYKARNIIFQKNKSKDM